MRVIREGVFETNSSSTHSICIKGGEFAPDAFPLDDGVCKVHPGEFGWDVREFRSPQIKASYCLTHAKESGGDKRLLPMLTAVLGKATGCEVEFVSAGGEYYEWGYIDHQSSGVCAEAFESEETLRDFIFNPDSWLKTDNDNH